ncbi:carbon storage regulator [Paenibacillus sp. 598K]|uniref:carbon storage regulator CsrA n=1 Tax=Paenibacillus sp. 598K TaxID=1117987 RepID=UPI000FFAE3AD|nr:carbon storage regulator CsrA [Paenibacillus sp. 598K]GBF76281.1 carbon storage regulator [Paenibacillus sp. 598K]
MLVLSRKSDESIIIDGKIEVVVLGIEGDVVKLGIKAPKEIDIYRKEIYLTIQNLNQAALQTPASLKQLTAWLEMGDQQKKK